MSAILLECSNMPPYAYAVQRATGLPVFDCTTLSNYMVAGIDIVWVQHRGSPAS